MKRELFIFFRFFKMFDFCKDSDFFRSIYFSVCCILISFDNEESFRRVFLGRGF